jgi:hypothetical protein
LENDLQQANPVAFLAFSFWGISFCLLPTQLMFIFSFSLVYKIIMKTMTGHFVCGVDSPLNVIWLMKYKENQILAAE